MKSKIIHTSHHVGAQSFGIGPVPLNLAKGQNAANRAAEIWSFDSHEGRMEAVNHSGISGDIIKIHQLEFPRMLGFSRIMRRRLLEESNSIEMIHQHGLWTGISRISLHASTRLHIPVTIAPHGSLEPWALKKSRVKKWAATNWYERANLFNASCIHACSDQEAEGIREYGLKSPIAVIPNGVSEQWLQSKGNASHFTNKFGIGPERKLILYFSRLAPVKGLPLLLKSIHRIRAKMDPKWMLVIAGSGESSYVDELSALVTSLEIEASVKLVGYLDGQTKRDAFEASEFFVLPTQRENFGIVVAESLSCGLPAIVTKGAPWSLLESSDCGWWVEPDEAILSEVILKAMNSSEYELKRMGENGKFIVSRFFQWSKASEMSIQLCDWLNNRITKPNFVRTY